MLASFWDEFSHSSFFSSILFCSQIQANPGFFLFQHLSGAFGACVSVFEKGGGRGWHPQAGDNVRFGRRFFNFIVSVFHHIRSASLVLLFVVGDANVFVWLRLCFDGPQ